jgi:thiol-disulfide isomerase/thioredoxin
MRPPRFVAVLFAAVLLAGCSSATNDGTGFVTGDGTLTVLPAGQRPTAPTITGTTLDGATWHSADAAGKVIVYNVWGSWCAPCRAEAAELVAAANRTSGTSVFVGLNTRDLDTAAPKAFVRAFDVPYPNLYDPDGALLLTFSSQLPANAIPSTLVVDPSGKVAARIIGATTQATLVGLIDDLAAGR